MAVEATGRVVLKEDLAPTPVAVVRTSATGPLPAPDAKARAWWTVTGITLVIWGFQLFGFVDMFPWLALPVAVLVLWGLGTVVSSWLPLSVDPRWTKRLAVITLLLAVGAFFVWSYLQVVSGPQYGTDEIAFDQYAAQLLIHGLNPYAHSMAPAFSQFHVSPDGYTFLLNGSPVTRLSYPALSFLLYAPLIWLGWSTQLAIAVNVIAWGVGMVLAFWLLPRSVRPLAIVVGSLSVYIGYAVGGVTDALFVPMLIGGVYAWDRFARTTGPRAWLGPILVGLAMAVKQTPWLVVPFLVIGTVIEARSSGSRAMAARTAGRYVAISLGTFLLINAPFIVAGPHQWLAGILTPIASHTVPAGEGLVGLSLFLGLGGGSLTAYSGALLAVLVVLLIAYAVLYRWLKPWAVMLPAVVLFFSARSFGSYFVTLFLAGAVAAFTTRGAPAVLRRRPRWKFLTASSTVLVAASLAWVLLSRPPLGVQIKSVETTGQLGTVDQIGVRVANHSGRDERPGFSVESGGTITAFWITKGPALLRPGTIGNYTLLSPNFFAQPPITGGFQVVAFTSSPGSVSRSGAYVPTTLHVALVPAAVDSIVPIGEPVTVTAEVLDDLNRPVHESGVPVYLGQAIYAQSGLEPGDAIVSGSNPGETPVSALTNSDGQATFTIQGTQDDGVPVYFEANLVKSGQYYPYGYSEILPIRFGK